MMLALKKLYENGHLDHYLLPKIGGWITKNTPSLSSSMSIGKKIKGAVASSIEAPLIKSQPYLQPGQIRKVIIP